MGLVMERPGETADEVLRLTDRLVEEERLVRGHYALPQFGESGAAESLCGGVRGCLVGCMWLAAGVPLERGDLPSASSPFREEELDERPHLREAYEAMHEEAREMMVELGLEAEADPGRDWGYAFAAERFLEARSATDGQVRELIERARKRLREAT